MAKKTGLGKGLGALFNDNVIDDDDIEIKEGEEVIRKIKIIDIEPNKDQPRRNFNNESIDELAESIKTYGVIQPIIVTKKDKYYEIVAGERRWRASKKAGLDGIVCSPLEVEKVKAEWGKEFVTVTPGIRLASNNKDDQVRITTPKMAREIGSDYIVVGRPITQALDPVKAYKEIKKEFLGNE